MQTSTVAALAGYALAFSSMPFLRAKFLRYGQTLLFWILVLEYLVMYPLTIIAFMAAYGPDLTALAFCLGALTASVLLFLLALGMTHGMSSGGWGIMIFLLFPFISALGIVAGAVSGLVHLLSK